MVKSDRPRQPRRITGKWWALLLAVAVQLGFLVVLVFSVQWQNRAPVPVTAELYAPPVKAPPMPTPPSPEPEPVKPPPVTPSPPPPPDPVTPKADPHAADIALKAKQEEERKKKTEAERRETERKTREAKEAEDKRKLDEKRQADARERAQREMTALRAQAEREAQARAQAERDAQLRAQAEREAQVRAREAAEGDARSKSQADWIRRIQAKVKGNVVVPSDLPGNPEAIFEVVQLPTGEIIDATLRKSSGSRAYDEAVQRAILKSSPLPRPDRPDLFQRTLTLKFRPQD
ncbi:MAG: cell envelope integrity protein TolA [Betaproteobacteria bacterium]